MMSNCAFWSESGELVAVHGEGAPDPAASFGPWAKAFRLPPGRLVTLSPGFPLAEAPGPGWHLTVGRPAARRARSVPTAAPVAVAAPALDAAAAFLLPPRFVHERFTLKAVPTWVTTARPEDETAEGWSAALDAGKQNQFLVRLVPHRGRLPGQGWRNMLAWTLREYAKVRLAPLNGLPTPAALNAAPAWEYRVEAGADQNAAAWDVQLLPSRGLLASWTDGIADPWEATALLRWVRPVRAVPADEPSSGWAGLLSRLPAADARLLVQNVLTTLPGGAAAAAPLFFESVVVSAGGTTLLRHVPDDGVPVSLLSTLFGRRAWHEIERARRQPPPDSERRRLRDETLADLDARLAEGRLVWSDEARDLWDAIYRIPRHRAQEQELARLRSEARWSQVLSDAPLAEALLRSLDVTDAAICLRDAPDQRWRRFVTARREAELRAEFEFVRVWAARGELSLERELDAWREWDRLARLDE